MHADVCPQLTSSARDFGQATSSGSLPSGCLLPMGLGSSRNELPTPDFCLFCCASYTDTKKYRIAISKYVPHCDQGAKAPSVHLRRPPTSGSCMCCASQYIAVAQALARTSCTPSSQLEVPSLDTKVAWMTVQQARNPICQTHARAATAASKARQQPRQEQVEARHSHRRLRITQTPAHSKATGSKSMDTTAHLTW